MFDYSRFKFNKNFWVFRITQFGGLFSTQLASIAISIYILNKTSSAAAISCVLVPATFIGLLFSIILAPIADNTNRKIFMILGSFAKAFAWLLIFGYLLFSNTLNIIDLGLLYILNSIGSAMVLAGASGFLPEIVNKNRLEEAYRVNTGTDAIVRIFGGALAGIIISCLGIVYSLLINISSFILSGLALFFVQSFNKKEMSHKIIKNNFRLTNAVKSWQDKFLNGFFYIIRSHGLIILAVALMTLQFVLASLQIALPFFVKKHLHESSRYLGILMSAEGCGAVIASVGFGLLAWIGDKKVIIIGVLTAAFGILVFSFHLDKFIYLFGIALISFGINIASIVFNTTLMKIVDEQFRSSFFTFLLFIENALVPISLFIAGYLIDSLGIISFFVISGLSLVSIALWFCCVNVLQFIEGSELAN